MVVYGTVSQAPADSYLFNGYGTTILASLIGGSWQRREICPGGSYLCGLSRDRRYLALTEQKEYAFMLDLDSAGLGPLRLHDIGNVPIQVCNGSISSSNVFTNTMMYLDFGCRSSPWGTWGLHQRIFIGRADGSVMRAYNVPGLPPPDAAATEGTGEIVGIEWNYPEWSNHPYFAAVTLQFDRLWLVDTSGTGRYDHTFRNEKICLYNLRDSSYLPIISITDTTFANRTDLNHPWAWIQVPTGFSEDPQWLLPPVYPATRPPIHIDPTPAIDTTNPGGNTGKRSFGCGRGFGLALLPPLCIRAAKELRRQRHPGH